MKFLIVLALLQSLALFAADNPPNKPVLVELFTSEGCSSCPPADALLRDLDKQPIPGVDLIVLSEHVDYWNHIGWKDPYSSKFFSDRQGDYAQKLGLGDVYTPQMIVDGAQEFVGSDNRKAQIAIEKSRSRQKLTVSLSSPKIADGILRSQIAVAAVPESSHLRNADVYVAIALNHAESQVLRGENEGRRLEHVAVVQSISRLGSVSSRQAFMQNAAIKLEGNPDSANLRVIVFVQDRVSGQVIGAVEQKLN